MTSDSITRDITIHAPIDRIWELVCQPAWWFSDDKGDQSAFTFEPRNDGMLVTCDPIGEVLIETAESRPTNYVRFEGTVADPDTESSDKNMTTIEFSLVEVENGVRVTVTETGFSQLPERIRDIVNPERNVVGWDIQLGLVKRRAEDATS